MNAKSITALQLSLLFIFSSGAQIMKTDREKHGLYGPVRSVRTEISLASNESGKLVQGERTLNEFYAYDPKGRVTEEISEEEYIDQGPWKSVYTYDHQGRVSEKAGFDESGSPTGKIIYAYNSKGNKTEEQYYDPAGHRYIHLFYDARGNVTESFSYDTDGSIRVKETFVYKYKAEGNKVEETVYRRAKYQMYSDEHGHTFYTPFGRSTSEKARKLSNEDKLVFLSKQIISYNEDGRKIEEAKYDSSGALYSKKKFNAEGVLLEDGFNYDADGTPQGKNVYTYDVNGKLIRIVQKIAKGPMAAKAIDRKYAFTHDDNGNTTENAAYEANGSLYSKETYTYEYDSHRNWIKQVKRSVNNTGHDLTTIFYRTITYY